MYGPPPHAPYPPPFPGQPFPGPPPVPDGAAEPVSAGRRALAWCVDFGLMIGVAGLLGGLTYERMLGPLSGVNVTSGIWAVLTSGGEIAGVAADAGAAVWRVLVGLVVQAFAALVLVQFLYQFLALAWTGRTLGKALVDVRVVSAAADPAGAARRGLRKGRAFRRAAVTALTDTGLFALACCLLLAGEVLLSVVCWLIAVLGFWVNVLPVLGRRRRTLADRCAGTVVSRGGVVRAVVQGVAQGRQVAAERLARGRQAAADGLVQGRQAAAERFAEGRRVAAEGGRQAARSARELANHERVQQALASQRAQQVREAGQQAAARGAQAATRGLQALRRLRPGDQDSQAPRGG